MMMQPKKTFQTDEIDLQSGIVIQRSDLVRRIIGTAESRQHVVASSSPATGKTSLTMLVEAELSGRSKEGPVYMFQPSRSGVLQMSFFV
jgi:hypothetical protein